MSSDENQVQSTYRYTRKSYKKLRRESHENGGFSPNEAEDNVDQSPWSDRAPVDPSCSYDDHEGNVANILHKKCPVITLATQQLQRLLDDTDKILCDNTRCCRSLYDVLVICLDVLHKQKCICSLCILIVIAFFLGLLLGAASCGTYLGHFNSPIMTCLDRLLTPEPRASLDDYRGIII